jgi:hypothetical protein
MILHRLLASSRYPGRHQMHTHSEPRSQVSRQPRLTLNHPDPVLCICRMRRLRSLFESQQVLIHVRRMIKRHCVICVFSLAAPAETGEQTSPTAGEPRPDSALKQALDGGAKRLHRIGLVDQFVDSGGRRLLSQFLTDVTRDDGHRQVRAQRLHLARQP